MNCDTGQITNDPELIKQWREAGVPVMDLPDFRSGLPTLTAEGGFETLETPPVVSAEESARKRLERALNNKALDRLCGKR